MPKPLAVGGSGSCSHGGTISFTSGSSKLTVGGAAVVVSGQEAGVTISACPAQTSSSPPVSSPCTVTSSATQGVSTKLTVGGQGVILDNAQGSTVNPSVPGGTWSISAPGQSKLSVSS